MGAYENPAMIVDKSGEILAAGILQGVQSLAQGIDKYSQTVNEAWQERIKRDREAAEKREENNKRAQIDGAKVNAEFTRSTQEQAESVLDETGNGVIATSIVNQHLQNIKDNSKQTLDVFASANNLNNSGEVLAENTLKSEEIIQNAKKPFTWAGNVHNWYTEAGQAYTNPQGTVYFDNDENTQEQSQMISNAMRQDVFEGKISPSISFVKKTDSSMMNLEFFENGESIGLYKLDMSDPNAMDKYVGKGLDYTETIKLSSTEDRVDASGVLKPQFFQERITFRDKNETVSREVYNIQQIESSFKGVVDGIVTDLSTFSNETSGSDYLKARQWVMNQGAWTREQADAILKNENGDAVVDGVKLPTPKEMAMVHLLNYFSGKGGFEYRDGKFFKETRTKRQRSGTTSTTLTENQKDAKFVRSAWKANTNDIGIRGRKFVLKPRSANTVGGVTTYGIPSDPENIHGYEIYEEKVQGGDITLVPMYAETQKVFEKAEDALQVIGNSDTQIFSGVNTN